jgi:hypothetical protein
MAFELPQLPYIRYIDARTMEIHIILNIIMLIQPT